MPGPAAWCARGRRPAREIATREPSARSDRSRSPARPCRRPRAPQTGPPARALGPTGALQTAGAWCGAGVSGQALPPPTGAAAWISSHAAPSKQQGLRVLLGCLARPCRRPRAPQPGPAVTLVPPAPFQQQGLRVLLGCLARPCRRPRPPVGLRGGLPAEWLRVLDRKLCSG